MNDLYLILHKVRGEPAVDVAARIYLSGGDCIWWIPTSGHRAYPLHFQALNPEIRRSAEAIDGARWQALPDHYPRIEPRPSLVARLRARLWASLTAWVLREIWKVRAKRDVGKATREATQAAN